MTPNGNGEKPPKKTPLEEVEELIAFHAQEEASSGSGETEALHAWKDLPLNPSEMHKHLHRGLIEISQIAEAAIESNIRNHGDIIRVEATMSAIRKDVQTLKDDVRDMKLLVGQIPAIKNLLTEILARLP